MRCYCGLLGLQQVQQHNERHVHAQADRCHQHHRAPARLKHFDPALPPAVLRILRVLFVVVVSGLPEDELGGARASVPRDEEDGDAVGGEDEADWDELG